MPVVTSRPAQHCLVIFILSSPQKYIFPQPQAETPTHFSQVLMNETLPTQFPLYIRFSLVLLQQSMLLDVDMHTYYIPTTSKLTFEIPNQTFFLDAREVRPMICAEWHRLMPYSTHHISFSSWHLP